MAGTRRHPGYAKGSGQAMGLWNTFVTTTLRRTGQNYYEVVGSAC
ncbi:hypothetical protein ACGFNP_05340 [Nonomuraea sp. NPDC049269]